MSEPTAVTGEVPNTRISSGVMSEPPPMPVIPTKKPIPKPNGIRSGSIASDADYAEIAELRRSRLLVHGVDEDVGDLGARELLRRPLAGLQHLAHLGSRQEDAILGARARGLAGRHSFTDTAIKGVLEHHRLDLQLLGRE